MKASTEPLAVARTPERPSEDVRHALELLDALEPQLDPVMIPSGVFEPEPLRTIEARLQRARELLELLRTMPLSYAESTNMEDYTYILCPECNGEAVPCNSLDDSRLRCQGCGLRFSVRATRPGEFLGPRPGQSPKSVTTLASHGKGATWRPRPGSSASAG